MYWKRKCKGKDIFLSYSHKLHWNRLPSFLLEGTQASQELNAGFEIAFNLKILKKSLNCVWKWEGLKFGINLAREPIKYPIGNGLTVCGATAEMFTVGRRTDYFYSAICWEIIGLEFAVNSWKKRLCVGQLVQEPCYLVINLYTYMASQYHCSWCRKWQPEYI